MDEIKDKDELLKDLKLIREAVKRNSNIFRHISLARGMKNVALFTGLLIIMVNLALLLMTGYYGSYEAFPDAVKLMVYVVTGLSFAGLALYKIHSVLKAFRRYKKDMNLVMLIKEMYTRTFLMLMVPLLLSVAVFCIYLPVAGLSHMIVPVISIFVALMIGSMMVVINMKELLLCSEWLLVSGSFTLFLSGNASPYVLMIATFGAGFLVLYFSILWSISREKRG